MSDSRFPMRIPPIPPLWPFLSPAGETLALVGAGALFARYAERWLDAQSLALFFVVPIIVAAIRRGLWASLGASFLSALALNFLFVEPRYTLAVARPQDAAALALLAIVGVLASAVAAQARSAALSAQQRAHEAQLLQTLATRLSSSSGDDEIAAACLQTLSELSQEPAALIGADERAWGATLADAERDVARWAMSTKLPFALAGWRFWPALFGGRSTYALGVRAVEVAPDVAQTIAQVATQVGMAMERARATRSEAAARLDVESERFKSELLAGVSHDLRTPLSTIVFTLQSVQRFASDHPPEVQAELLTLAEKEARRLAELVDALLSASRLDAGVSPVRLQTIAPSDLIGRACAAANEHEAIDITGVAAGLPLISADIDLAARALGNVIANARRHGGANIAIAAACEGDSVAIRVSDDGEGLGDNPERLFERFVRGKVSDGRAPGLGLGLALSRRFLEQQGGRISAQDNVPCGAVFTITLPCAPPEHADAR